MRLVPLTLLIVAACGGRESPTEQPGPDSIPLPRTVDCTAANPACPELSLAGDAPARLPGGAPSPARGFADPSIRRVPAGGTLWMAYSWPYTQDGVVRVDSHLARSDDGGASWRFTGELWRSLPTTDERGRPGWTNSEVVSLAPRAAGGGIVWYSARLRYFTAPGVGPQGPSFTIQVGAASSPEVLAEAEEATLGGRFTHPHWRPDVDLTALSPELGGCTWNDPGLLYHDETLWLAMQCSVFVAGEEPPDRQFVAVFATTPSGSPREWRWRYTGRLAGPAEAVELGGETLMQTDLAVGADGRLLAIVSPSRPAQPLATHYGCRVVEVASLEPARLARDAGGRLLLRASVTAGDLLPSGPGACGYDAAPATGVVLTRRVLGPGQLVVALHATGLRP